MKPDTTLNGLSKLKTSFKKEGTVTWLFDFVTKGDFAVTTELN